LTTRTHNIYDRINGHTRKYAFELARYRKLWI